MKDSRLSPPMRCSFFLPSTSDAFPPFSGMWERSPCSYVFHIIAHFYNKFISVQIWPRGTPTLNTKCASLLHFTWLSCVTRCSKCTAAALACRPIPLYPAWLTCCSRNMIIPHDPASVCLSLHHAGLAFCARSTSCRNVSGVRGYEGEVWVKTRSSDCISSRFLTQFHSGGPFGEICTIARLDHSAVPRVCEETLGKVRLDRLKDGPNVT